MAHATTDDGVRLYFEETGSGHPVILVHEFAGDLRSWEQQMRYFGKRYRTIAFNARGFPPSDVPEHVSSYSQARAADDILAVLDHLGEPQAHVIGLSMGGFAVFHFGFKYPEMFGMLSGMCAGVSDPRAAPRPNAPNRVQSPYMLANNPFILAETNLAAIKGRFKIRSVVGTDDFTLESNKEFDARLTSLGIAHDFTIVPHVSHGYKEYYEILDFSFFKTIATTM